MTQGTQSSGWFGVLPQWKLWGAIKSLFLLVTTIFSHAEDKLLYLQIVSVWTTIAVHFLHNNKLLSELGSHKTDNTHKKKLFTKARNKQETNKQKSGCK